MRRYLLLIFIFFTVYQAVAQRANASWKDYLSYNFATKVAVSPNKIFCATKGGLFYYDREDNSVNKFNESDGLSDVGIETISYSDEYDLLIVAYTNCNIDLVYNSGSIINIPYIKLKQFTGEKKINNIPLFSGEAYLACSFGIVVLDLDKREVENTYIIGEGGGYLVVNDIEVFENNIYAATNEGLYVADYNSPNLLDYENWHRIENVPHFSEKFNHLVVHSGTLIANYTQGEPNNDEMFQLNEGNWVAYLPEIKYVSDAQENNGYLVIAGKNEVLLIDNSHNIVGKINSLMINGVQSYIMDMSAAISNDGMIWIADYEKGLVRVSSENAESICPNGPLDNEIFSLYTNGNDLWVAPGGRTSAWNNSWKAPYFQLYREGVWKSFLKKDYPGFEDFPDVITMIADPNDANHIFVGSWGGGLIEFQGNELVNHYTNQNSPLETALPDEPTAPYVRIAGLAYDSENNLWITNSEVAFNLLKLTPSGEWESYKLPEIANKTNVGEMVITDDDDKWILVPQGHDVYVVDKSGNNTIHLPVTAYFNNGTYEEFNRMNDVYSIAKDQKGDIWIGTSKGVAVFSNPSQIWNEENYYATQPSLDLNNGLFNPLLETETVTSIVVDGANRKWLGTDGSGVYLVSESGDEEILHFTKDNSPLLSNTIRDIAINQKTGEVFIGTDAGLISYQGDAVEGNDDYKNVYVFPNPVRETYDGPVTITGLVDNTDIKITDISGNLVYHSRSLGGQATWDGKNLNGNRVRTGVYLVFCNDETGEKTHIAKLLFIN